MRRRWCRQGDQWGASDPFPGCRCIPNKVRLACLNEASGGEPDGVLIIRLLGRSSAAAKDIVKPADKARATALLQDALKAPLIHDKLKTEITARLAEVKATP